MFGQSNAVIQMLKEDHQKVKDLFEEFKKVEDASAKRQIVETAITELEVHAKLEEGLIYPAIRPQLDEDDLMDEALEEHHVVHLLIAELKKMKPTDERFDAKFTVLGESVKHHIKEEEAEMLPKAEKSNIDWDQLETQVTKRKEQLLSKSSASSPNGKARAAKKSAR
jgi:hypothetical protein